MFRNTSIREIESSLEKIYHRDYESRSESLLRFLLDVSKDHRERLEYYDVTDLRIPLRRKSQKIGLAIISWWFPEEIRYLVQLRLREIWDSESKEVGEVLLTSKDFAVAWLIFESDWTENDFFGNVLDKWLAYIWNSERMVGFREYPSSRGIKRYTGWSRGHQESNHRSFAHEPSVNPRRKVISVEEDLLRKQHYEAKLLLLIASVKFDISTLQDAEQLFP